MKNTKIPQIFIEYYIGIDISKDTIHCYLKPANDSKEDREENHKIVDNNPEAIKRYIVSVLKDKKIVGVVMENTGGYELYAAETFTEAGYSVSVADAGQARSLKNGMGINAKTDKVDAFALAKIAQGFWGDEDVLSIYVPMSKSLEELQDTVDRYLTLTRSIARCKNRLKKPRNKKNKAIVKSLKRELKWLQKEREAFAQDIRTLIANDPQMAKWDEILQSVPGIGNIISATLIAFLPELGKLNRAKIASLAGLAPHPCDSGTKHGSRHAKKGRQRIKAVWMPAIACSIQHNPVLKAFYQQLTARGKEKKVAMIACMRKLLVIVNQMIRNNQKWGENKVQRNEPQDNVQTTSAPAADELNNQLEQTIEEKPEVKKARVSKKQTSIVKSVAQRKTKKKTLPKNNAVRLL